MENSSTKLICSVFIQSKIEEYPPECGYEYPPEPEIDFSKYKRKGNDDDDDVENGDDDDDDFDDIKSDSKNFNGRKSDVGNTTFNMNTG